MEALQTLCDDLRAQRTTPRKGDGFADELTAEPDGGTILGRAVPYDQPVELMPGLVEVFTAGTFARQTRAPDRVKVCLEHGQVIGRIETLEERDTGLYFTARISDSPDIPEARKARAMIADRLADELSIGFQTVRDGSTEITDGTTTTWTHHRARLMEISLVPWGAYGRHATLGRARLTDPRQTALRARQTAARQRLAELRHALALKSP